MYVRNGILYDNNGDPCVEKDRVRVVLADNSVIEDIITWIGEEQDKGFEDNDIYFKNRGIVPLYNMKEVYKIFNGERTDKTETYTITASAETETGCRMELNEDQLETIMSLFAKLDGQNTGYAPFYRIEDSEGFIVYETKPI